MLRRMLLVAWACVFLLLPLMWLMSMATLRTSTQEGYAAKLLPMLPLDVQQSLPTYRRECHTDADCDPQLGCLIAEGTSLQMCLDSTCETDKQCDEGFSCVPLKTVSGKSIVRTCALVGERKEGERCNVFPLVRDDGCERGLLCQKRCGRPCRLDDPSTCPVGFFCSDGKEGPPSCLPTCEGRSCPEGLQCLKRGRGSSICARVHGEDCRKTPCPDKHLCRVLEPPQRPWELRTECRRLCLEDFPCPEGDVCVDSECRKPATCGTLHPVVQASPVGTIIPQTPGTAFRAEHDSVPSRATVQVCSRPC